MLFPSTHSLLSAALLTTALLAPSTAALPGARAFVANDLVERFPADTVPPALRVRKAERASFAHLELAKRATTTKKKTTTPAKVIVRKANTTSLAKYSSSSKSAATSRSKSLYSSSSKAASVSKGKSIYSSSSKAAAAAASAQAGVSKSASLAAYSTSSQAQASVLSASSSRAAAASASASASLASASSASASSASASALSASLASASASSASVASSVSAASASSASASASAASVSSANAAIQTLATGASFVAGQISSTFKWQASGLFTKGCPTGVDGLSISTCYHIFMNATGDLQGSAGAASARKRDFMSSEERAAMWDDDLDSYFDAFPEQIPSHLATPEDGHQVFKRQIASCSKPTNTATATVTVSATTTTITETATATATSTGVSPRQRTEMLSWPGSLPNSTWHYEWKSYQSTDTTTGNSFFHSWQLLRRDFCGGPVVTLDYVKGQAVITDIVRPCAKQASGACPGVPLTQWLGKTIQHSLTVKWGLQGTIDYTATDIAAGNVLIAYQNVGDMGSSASVKFGTYRNVFTGIQETDGYVGDYSAKQISSS